MSAPFYKYGLFNDEVSLIVAVFIGLGFGFFLERAGFGNGRKLAAQFYFTDMTVLKVMFTAIVTAMVGVYYLSIFGFLDLSLVYVTPTNLVPQITGGLILGIGFVIGGYCPGTACVSASTGRYDGWAYVAGLFAGILFFGEVFHLFEKFYTSTAMGKVTLPQLFHLPYGLMVFLVCIMALGAFAAAEWGEKKMAAKKED
ncbi:MAG TPA: YeeE/YedE thiosulfate transporter family protein [bacterium]|nr:YeeE/YedE thiosulfate transporter family protein [bacterium]